MRVRKSNELIVRDASLETRLARASEQKTSIDDFINEFLSNFLSPQTKRAYVKDLMDFFNFLKAGNITLTTPSDIKSAWFKIYRDEMINKGFAPATLNRRLVAIRSFVKWAVAMKLMDHNPLDAVKLPKVSTLSPTIAFDDEEVTRMMSCPDISTKTGNTHRLIIVLLFYLGTRRSELVNIRCKDIFEDRGHRVLRIVGKGKKERNIPLADFVIDEIDSYKKRFFSLTGQKITDEDFLVQTRPKGKNTVPADGSTIYRIISDYSRKLGINKHVGPHSCRATVISHLLDTQHKSIRDVAIFAGHSNITTTERYDKKRKGLDDNPAYAVDFEGPKKSPSD